jgi:hypothetical protein
VHTPTAWVSNIKDRDRNSGCPIFAATNGVEATA